MNTGATYHRYRQGERSRRGDRVAAEQGESILSLINRKARSQRGDFVCRPVGRPKERQQITERRGALGRQIGQIHPQRFARDEIERIVAEKMHAFHDGVCGDDDRPVRRNQRRIVQQRPRARMRRERREIARDYFEFVVFRARHRDCRGCGGRRPVERR